MERRLFFRTALVACAVVGVESMQAQPASAFFWFWQLDRPCLKAISATPGSITIEVKAGSSGTPGGFTVQWMKKSDFHANGNCWYKSSDPRLSRAIFAASSSHSPYALRCCAAINVEIGNLPSNVVVCGPATLERGVEYIFRAFAHGTSFCKTSGFSNTLCASTSPGLPPV